MLIVLIRMFKAMIQAVLVFLAIRLMDDLAESICWSSHVTWRAQLNYLDGVRNGRNSR